MVRARRPSLILLLAAGACSEVFPYASQEVQEPDSADRGTGIADNGTADYRTRPDSADYGDYCCRMVGTCCECEPIPNRLLGICPSSCTAGDCDAIPDERDPWPGAGQCNALSVLEEFCTMEGWSRPYEDTGATVEVPGILSLNAGQGLTEWVWLTSGMDSASNLVEVRWQPPATGSWAFALWADVDGDFTVPDLTRGRACRVELGAGADYYLEAKDLGGTTPGARIPLPSSSAPAVLQSWFAEGYQYCRLVPEDDTPSTRARVASSAPLAGTIALFVNNLREEEAAPLSIAVDYVRAFAPLP